METPSLETPLTLVMYLLSPFYWDDALMETLLSEQMYETTKESPFYWDDALMETVFLGDGSTVLARSLVALLLG
jgi:hypothetical protein